MKLHHHLSVRELRYIDSRCDKKKERRNDFALPWLAIKFTSKPLVNTRQIRGFLLLYPSTAANYLEESYRWPGFNLMFDLVSAYSDQMARKKKRRCCLKNSILLCYQVRENRVTFNYYNWSINNAGHDIGSSKWKSSAATRETSRRDAKTSTSVIPHEFPTENNANANR